MHRNTYRWALAALVACSVTGSAMAQEAAAKSDLSVDDIIAMNIEAKGGSEAFDAIESARIAGKMVMAPGMEAPMTMEFRRPNNVRVEFEFQGQKGIQAFDGETGWMLMPFMGKTEPEKIPEEQIQQLKDQAEFIEGPLFNYKKRGYTAEYLGTEEVEGTETYKIRLSKESGEVTDFFIDTDSNIEIMSSGKQNMQGMEMEVDMMFGDFKEVGGILWAHSLEIRPKGAPQGQTITFDKVELNVDLPDDRFAFPAAEGNQ